MHLTHKPSQTWNRVYKKIFLLKFSSLFLGWLWFWQQILEAPVIMSAKSISTFTFFFKNKILTSNCGDASDIQEAAHLFLVTSVFVICPASCQTTHFHKLCSKRCIIISSVKPVNLNKLLNRKYEHHIKTFCCFFLTIAQWFQSYTSAFCFILYPLQSTREKVIHMTLTLFKMPIGGKVVSLLHLPLFL